MGKVLSGELSCTGTDLVRFPSIRRLYAKREDSDQKRTDVQSGLILSFLHMPQVLFHMTQT